MKQKFACPNFLDLGQLKESITLRAPAVEATELSYLEAKLPHNDKDLYLRKSAKSNARFRAGLTSARLVRCGEMLYSSHHTEYCSHRNGSRDTRRHIATC
eukprot:9104328-Pyramimonas_sp.AAC.3